MHPGFTSKFFTANRQRLRQAIASEVPVVVTANGLVQRGADSAYEFAQDANFWYLTGIDEPDITLVMDGEREFLVAPVREGARATFDGAINVELLAAQSGITDIQNEAAGWKRLDGILERTKKAATLAAAPSYIEQFGMYANPARARLFERLQKHSTEVEMTDIRMELARLRMIKQPVELAAIQRAIDITAEALTEALTGNRKKYKHEYQLEASITAGFRRRGANGHAFEPIVAGGPRACTLHNVANNSLLKPDELVVLDVGADFSHYAADITRTVALQKPMARQADVYAAVLDVQNYAKSLLKPGIHLKSYEKKVETYMGRKLHELGLIKKSDHEAIRHYFPHATSHFMGLNVHDVGDYQQVLKEGVVLTVEPGIYIPEEGIGVRIEDDVLITKTGCQVLSSNLPRTLT